MNTNVIEVEGLTRKFGQLTAVDNAGFQIEKGEIFGFIGPSGSGKTTAMRMLCGILVPSAGKGRVGNYDILKESEKIKTIIGYTAQKFSLYEDLSVDENIEFFSNIYESKLTSADTTATLEKFGLIDYRKMLARNLSGGTKQKLALVCAISHNPRVLFLDELTAGIDPLSSREVWFMLYEFTKKGITIFVNTHMMNEAEHCNRLSFIFKGKIMATGSPQQLKTEYIKEKMLELSSKVPLIKIIGDFQKLSSILDVYTSGEFLHLTTKDEAAAKKQINDYARAKGYAFTIREISPSLEDVFVNLTRDLER